MSDDLRPDDPGRPVSRLVAPVVWRLGGMVALVGAVSVAGILLATLALGRLDGAAADAVEAQQRVSQTVADLQEITARDVEGAAGTRRQVEHADDLLIEALDDLDDAVAGGDDDLREAVEAQRAAVQTWLNDYARPAVDEDGGPRQAPAGLVARGERLYAAYRTARSEASSAVTTEAQSAVDAVRLRLLLTIVVALAVVGLAWVVVGRSRLRLLHELSAPLQELEGVVQRMLKNDPEGRAVDDRGPKEVRAIARVLNDFADAHSRARAVEGRIQDELRTLDSAKDDFVSNVSHELRTPLTTISGYLEMVADEFEGRLEPRHDRMLEATRRNVLRLRGLIDDLLALSTAENRATELEPADVVELVGDAVTDVRMAAARRSIAVDFTPPDEPMPVVSDRSMLYRAFSNLLTNAVKFSHEGGVVQVSVKGGRGRVEIAVRDRGIGIPRGELDRLGTRFFRASNAMTNEIAGTGLGLRIVQTIIDKHHGDVVIESAEGEGTTVYVRLRLAGDPAAPAHGPAAGAGIRAAGM